MLHSDDQVDAMGRALRLVTGDGSLRTAGEVLTALGNVGFAVREKELAAGPVPSPERSEFTQCDSCGAMRSAPASASVSDGKLDELRATVDGWDEEALERRDKFPLGHPKAMLHEEVARAYRRVSGEVDRLARKADPVAPAPRGDAEGHSYVLDDSASCRWCGRPRVDAERVTLVRWRGKGWQQTAPENRPKYEATAARLPGSVEVAEFVRLDPAPVSADDSTEGDG